MFKTIEITDCPIGFTIVYCLIGNRCIFMQLSPISPPMTINFAEDIIAEIYKKENNTIINQKTFRFYNLVIMDDEDDDYNPIKVFEFCEVVDDPEELHGIPIDWLHTKCPKIVIDIFSKYLTKCKKQTHHRIASGKGLKLFQW